MAHPTYSSTWVSVQYSRCISEHYNTKLKVSIHVIAIKAQALTSDMSPLGTEA